MATIYRSPRRSNDLPERTYLVEARHKSCKTQSQVVDEITEKRGVLINRSALARWESGLRKPDVDALDWLADVYGVSLDELTRAEITYRQEAGLSA